MFLHNCKNNAFQHSRGMIVIFANRLRMRNKNLTMMMMIFKFL